MGKLFKRELVWSVIWVNHVILEEMILRLFMHIILWISQWDSMTGVDLWVNAWVFWK